MTSINEPNVTVNINSAQTLISNQVQKILFIGQLLPAGSATALDLNTNMAVGAEDGLFGAKSILANMIRNARKTNGVNQFDAVGLADDGSAVAATGTITVVGTATAAGALTIIAGSESDYSVSVAVLSGDTETDVAANIVTAVNGLTNGLLLASNVAGVVTMTANNGGTFGNSIPLASRGTENVAGITTAVVTMASGATDPTLTTVFDNVGEDRYQAVVWQFAADTAQLRTFLDARFNVVNDVLDGVGFTGAVDTLANLESAYTSLNSESLVVFGFKKETETNFAGSALIEPPVMMAAQFAGIRSKRLTDGESISDIVISSRGALDSIGGAALASKPYFNTPMNFLFTEVQGRGWTRLELASLQTAGVSPMGNNRPATEVIVGEVVTTYKTDTGGNPDVTFKFLNFVDTASGAREFFVNNLNSTFAQSRLTSGDLVAGREMANEGLIRATLIGFYATLSSPQFVLTQAGETARQQFINDLTVALNLAAGSVTITMKTPIVTQVRIIIATMTIVFSPEA